MREEEKYVIDLSASRKKQVNESFLEMFGTGVKMIMQRMFGDSSIPVTIKGTKREIETFGKTLDRERRYIKAYKDYGLDDPRTYKNKAKLEKSVKDFERTTGLNWPFK